MEAEEIEFKNVKVTIYIHTIYITLYITYQLLYCIGRIQMTSNYNTREVEGEEIQYKNERSHSIYFAFIIHFITLTNYYIVQDRLRLQVITAQ